MQKESGGEENSSSERIWQYMAKCSGAFEAHGQLPGVAWWTSADTALYGGGITKIFW